MDFMAATEASNNATADAAAAGADVDPTQLKDAQQYFTASLKGIDQNIQTNATQIDQLNKEEDELKTLKNDIANMPNPADPQTKEHILTEMKTIYDSLPADDPARAQLDDLYRTFAQRICNDNFQQTFTPGIGFEAGDSSLSSLANVSLDQPFNGASNFANYLANKKPDNPFQNVPGVNTPPPDPTAPNLAQPLWCNVMCNQADTIIAGVDTNIHNKANDLASLVSKRAAYADKLTAIADDLERETGAAASDPTSTDTTTSSASTDEAADPTSVDTTTSSTSTDTTSPDVTQQQLAWMQKRQTQEQDQQQPQSHHHHHHHYSSRA